MKQSKILEHKIRNLQRELNEVVELLQNELEVLKKKESYIRFVGTLSGREAANILGFKHRHSFIIK